MFNFQPVEWHDSLPSTNTYLTALVKKNTDTPDGKVIAARTQTNGRGRQHRPWTTVANRNLSFSFLWKAPISPGHFPSMAQSLSVGIAKFLTDQGISPTIKWPNDVLINGRKISGILCETVQLGGSDEIAVVAGIGLNVNMTAEEAAVIDQPATSMALETQREHDVAAALPVLLDALATPLNTWALHGFPGIQDVYTNGTMEHGTRVSVRDHDRHVEGTLAGFNEHGALCLRLDDDTLQTFYSGDL